MKRLSAVALAFLLAGCGKSSVPAPVASIDLNPQKEAELIVEEPELQVQIPAEHSVVAGETLTSIALNYGRTYRELANWNGLHNPDIIQPGQRLRLSPPSNESVATAVRAKPAPALVASDNTSAAAVRPKAIVAVAPEAQGDAPPADNVPMKSAPLAAKYVYQPALLKKLREKWATTAAAPASPRVPATPAPAVAAVSSPATAPAAGAPAGVRKRFGVDWSWPAPRRADRPFSEARKGIEFFGKAGEPVYAAAAGEVVYVGTGVKSYGRLVILKHDNDYLTAYAHNDKVFVKEGERLPRGGKIAEFGESGAERVMLHFEVRKSGKPVDPMQVLPAKLQ